MSGETVSAVERVLAFVNTRDVDAGTDALDSPAAVKSWFEQQDLLGPGSTVRSPDMAQAIELREALRRALLAHHSGDAASSTASAVLATVPLQLVIAADGQVHVVPAGNGLERALGELVADIPAAVSDGTWQRAKVCPRDDCQWAFLDQSRNRSRRWCSMEVCGNREKTQSFRDRHRSRD